jgi:AbrB family transcriptional regulator (stage V sporulation protein T)
LLGLANNRGEVQVKATGIVRRIDDLGRVVIPKEIRRNLRIREGDPLEIYVDREGEVILKKYSSIAELGEFVQEYADSLFEATGHNAFISDRDVIVAVAGAGISKRDYEDRPIAPALERAMDSRRSFMFSSTGSGECSECEVIEDDAATYTAEVIAPIVAGGDPIGAVVLASTDPNATMGTLELKLVETAAGFLARQMEQ